MEALRNDASALNATVLNRPYWLEHATSDYPPLTQDLEVDVTVIGAGITGLTAAYLLKQAGKTVALLEMNRVGYGATGYTTAKLAVGHGLIYDSLIASYDVETASRYARSNQEAIEQVARIVGELSIECDFERSANYVYTESRESVARIEREVEAARAAGVEAELTTDSDLPYPIAAAIRVDGQAQFHPWKYLAALARAVDGDGSHVFESSRARQVHSGSPCVVETERATLRAGHVIVATQLPFLDRGLFFAKAHPTTSYAIAAAVDEGVAPRGMYISADQPTRSVRSTSGEDGRRIVIVGGEGHKPGAEPDTRRCYERLETFLADRFGATAEYRWSTHDFSPLDKLPYIGRLRRGDDRLLVATGFAKWGMTKGALAASMLTDSILGRPNEFEDLYDANRLEPRRSAARFAKENAAVGVHFFRDRVRSRPGEDEVARLAPGEGVVARIGGKHHAVSRRDDGELVTLSARCTHLGCIVGWNAADRAWECPCHGSRYTAEGTLVHGPATTDLPSRHW